MTRVRRTTLAAACLVTLLVLSLTGYAQAKDVKIAEKDVPAAVLAAFHKAYPNAQIKGTAKATENGKATFEIKSVDSGLSRTLLYFADGTVAEVEERVVPANLPAPVKAAVEAKYPGAKITRAVKKTRDAATVYDLKVDAGKTKMKLVIDPAGKIISAKESVKKSVKAGAKAPKATTAR